MVDLAFVLLFCFGLLLLTLAVVGYWHVSDKLWKAEMKVVVLEVWCSNLAENFVRLALHVDELTQAHNKLASDFIDSNSQQHPPQLPPSDINEGDNWKPEDYSPPWSPENN